MGESSDFAVIIGLAPSLGARSPVLWNAALAAHGLDIRMKPLDVQPQNLEDVLTRLQDDAHFIGGVVAAPFKSEVRRILGDSVRPDVDAHGSVNVIARSETNGLRGGNTDGVGAASAIEMRWSDREFPRTVVLGLGGVGRPVAVELRRRTNVVAVSRHQKDDTWCYRHGLRWCEWAERMTVLRDADLVINCTSLGDNFHPGDSPLTLSETECLKSDVCVFDVVYQPARSVFLQRATRCGLETLNGLSMNLLQAEAAFGFVFPHLEAQVTRRAMRSVGSS